MNLDYAIERLYATGWLPALDTDVETQPNGRLFPSLSAIEREFAAAGLHLKTQQISKFNCYRATWGPTDGNDNDRRGTVIGACQREAAVYALAQLRAANSQLATA